MHRQTRLLLNRFVAAGFLMAFFLALAPSIVIAAGHPLWGSLENGQFEVGFRTVTIVDHSRTFNPTGEKAVPEALSDDGRPLLVYVWYPAKKERDTTFLPFSEYAELSGTIGRHGHPNEESRKRGREEFIGYFAGQGAPAEKLHHLLSVPTGCVKNGIPEKGPFPLIAIAPGIGETPLMHSILAEYIASHGYIVVSVPSMGNDSREMRFTAACTEAQTRDLEFAIGLFHADTTVVKKRTGIVGFSLGSVSALILGMRNADIRCVVSLDGSIGFRDRLPLVRQSPFFDPERLTIPFLHMNVRDYQRNDLGIIDSLVQSQRTIISIRGIQHPNFTTMGMATGLFPGLWKIADHDARIAYETIARHTLAFLDAAMKNETHILPDSGVPKDFLTIRVIEKTGQVR